MLSSTLSGSFSIVCGTKGHDCQSVAVLSARLSFGGGPLRPSFFGIFHDDSDKRAVAHFGGRTSSTARFKTRDVITDIRLELPSRLSYRALYSSGLSRVKRSGFSCREGETDIGKLNFRVTDGTRDSARAMPFIDIGRKAPAVANFHVQ